ncbi:MAG: hypothetical protein P8Y42_17285 [Exilibacterium sp.]
MIYLTKAEKSHCSSAIVWQRKWQQPLGYYAKGGVNDPLWEEAHIAVRPVPEDTY